MMSIHDTATQEGEVDLYMALGQELRAVQEEVAATSGLESLRRMTEGRESVTDIVNLGKSFFENISTSAYDIVCGTGEGSADWKSLAAQGQLALIGAISALLVAHLAIVGAVASAVAAIIVKLFFDAANKEFCSRWKTYRPVASG